MYVAPSLISNTASQVLRCHGSWKNIGRVDYVEVHWLHFLVVLDGMMLDWEIRQVLRY